MPRRIGSSRACQVCLHLERGRIEYLLVAGQGQHGAGHRALAEKFAVSASSLWRHNRYHITEEYRRSVKIGPFESEAHLRKLCAESGASVIDHLNARYAGLTARWLIAFEAGDDEKLVRLDRQLHIIDMDKARLTKELLPLGAHQSLVQNFYMSPDFYAFQRRALTVLRRHPEALQDWTAEFRPDPPKLIEMAANAG